MEEVADSYFMTRGDEVYFGYFPKFNFEELNDTFYELIDEVKKLSFKNKELKKLNQTLIDEKNEFQKEKECSLPKKSKENNVFSKKMRVCQNKMKCLKRKLKI